MKNTLSVILEGLLRGDYRVPPKVVLIVKIVVTVVLLGIYVLNGDLNGLLMFLVSSL